MGELRSVRSLVGDSGTLSFLVDQFDSGVELAVKLVGSRNGTHLELYEHYLVYAQMEDTYYPTDLLVERVVLKGGVRGYVVYRMLDDGD